MGGVKGMDMVHFEKAGQLLLSRNSKLNPDKTERIPGIIGIGMGVSCSYNEGIPFFQQIIFSGDMEEAAAVEQEMNGEIGIVGISLYTKERFLITAAHPGGTDNKRQTGAAVFRGIIQVGSEIFGIIDILHDIFLPLK